MFAEHEHGPRPVALETSVHEPPLYSQHLVEIDVAEQVNLQAGFGSGQGNHGADGRKRASVGGDHLVSTQFTSGAAKGTSREYEFSERIEAG